jgi:hypothetical protein
MTNWHDSPMMIVKSADPIVHEGASLKMLNEIEALLVNGYTLKSTIECNGEIFVFAFLLNESELRGEIGSKTTTNTTIEEHTSEE